MKGKHFLALLAAVLAVCCLVLGLGGKKTGGTLPAPAAGTTAPRQTEPTGKPTEAAEATAAPSAEETTKAPETETTAETTAAAADPTTAGTAAETESAQPGTDAPTAAPETRPAGDEKSGQDYVANKNTLKFHYPACPSVAKMKESNRWDFHGTREELIAKGYVPCKRCSP